MKRLKTAACVVAAVAALALPTVASAGIVWNESAAGTGDLLGTAEVTYGTYGSLDGIHGTLMATVPVGGTPIFQVDLYKIYLNNAANFSARTTAPTAFDTALFLFDAAGTGVYTNDDNGLDLLSKLPAGDPNSPAVGGIYYLAVAFGGYSALDASDLSVFLAGGFTDVLGPDPGAGALNHWSEGFNVFSDETPFTYDIELVGAGAIPEPSSIALVLAAGLGAWVTRRSSRAPAIAAA